MNIIIIKTNSKTIKCFKKSFTHRRVILLQFTNIASLVVVYSFNQSIKQSVNILMYIKS